MFSKAPTLAWFLLALSCLMVGAFLGEAQHQISAGAPVYPTIGVAVAVEIRAEPTATPYATATPTPYVGPPSRN